MRQLYALSLILLLTVSNCYGQWNIEGDSAISVLDAECTFLKLDKNDVPYVVYYDPSHYNRAILVRLEKNGWKYVGPSGGFTPGAVMCPALAFDTNNIPYVVFTDGPLNNRTSVMKFNGSSWSYVGSAGFTPEAGTFCSIAIDSQNTIYVAFMDYHYGSRASVMKYDGNAWSYVGTPGFSPGTGNDGVMDTYICLDANGTPYVAFCDLYNGYKATVMKFDGTAWQFVGTPGFAGWTATQTKSLAFDSHGQLYITCSVGGKGAVMKYNGSQWLQVGGNFSAGHCQFADIALDSDDSIYVCYQDVPNSYRVSVVKFNGSSWDSVGTKAISPTEAYYSTMAIDKNKNIHVVYKDGTPYYGGWQYPHYRGVVLRYQGYVQSTPSQPSKNQFLNIYPNPTGDVISFSYRGEPSPLQINIRDELGQILISKNYSEQETISDSFRMKDFSKGIYFVEILTEKENVVRKVVLE